MSNNQPIDFALGDETGDGLQMLVDPHEDTFDSEEEMSSQDDSSDSQSDSEGDPLAKEETQASTTGSGRQPKLTAADKVSELSKDPEVQDYLMELVEKQVKKSLDKVKAGGKSAPPRNMKEGNQVNLEKEDLIKSPSDTTLYTPTFRKGVQENAIIDKISNFVESIRIEGQSSEQSARDRDRSMREMHRMGRSRDTPPKEVRSRSRSKSGKHSRHARKDKRDLTQRKNSPDVADEFIVQAEQFRAQVTAPKGRFTLGPEIELLRQNDNDDDFFHITCHIELSLREKIERGEFVELERLLTKDSSRNFSDKKRIELVSKGGCNIFCTGAGQGSQDK